MWGRTMKCLAQQPIDTSAVYSGNPFIKYIFAAHPALLVYIKGIPAIINSKINN